MNEFVPYYDIRDFCGMRFLSGDIIYPITSPPVKNGVIVIDAAGMILDILDPAKSEINFEVEKFEGILCPGFVNAHCHLELSHMKGRITTNSGLTGFINEIVTKRNEIPEIIFEQAKKADEEMYDCGIIAVGDISNSDATIDVKKNSRIFYHTFAELFDILPDRAQKTFDNGIDLLEKFRANNLSASLSPHAPYTVSEQLMKLIGDYTLKTNGILTIHNQETPSENDMFENGKGALLDQLRTMIPSFASWKSPQKSSLKYILDLLPAQLPLQLVHNTFTSKKDLSSINGRNLFWCICARANLYIENALPDIEILLSSGCKLTVGTDSYASNFTLFLLDELKTITEKFPSIAIDELLKWATMNGAEFLGISDKYGSLVKGKSPGIVWVDWEKNIAKRVG